MRKHILYLATTLLLGLGLFAASCNDDKHNEPAKPFEPTFPTKVTPTIAAGETYTLEIEPNDQWVLEFTNTTIETASRFWLQDGDQKTYTLRGNAGKRSIVIGTQEIPDLDKTHTCELTLTIKDNAGHQAKQVIAQITVDENLERKLSVYSVQIDSEGDFTFNSDPDGTGLRYLYEENPSTEFELMWPVGRNSYSRPILIYGNFDWAIRGALPDWLKDMTLATGKNGEQIELRLEAFLPGLPPEGAEQTITIGDQNQTFDIKVTIPDSREFFRVDNFAANSVFNYLGEVFVASNGTYSEGASAGNVTSAKDLKILKYVYISQMGGGYWDSESGNEWVRVVDKWDPDNGTVQTRRIEVFASAHAGDTRNAIVVGLPAGIAAQVKPWQLTDENGIKPEYQKYIITTVEQGGHPGPISVETDLEKLEIVGAAFSKVTKSDPELGYLINSQWAFNAPHVYKMIYTLAWSNEEWKLKFAEDSGIVEGNTIIYDETDYRQFEEPANPNSFWLKYLSRSGFNNQINMGSPAPMKKTGLVRFCDARWQTVAMIYCILDKDAPLGDGSVEFQYPDLVQRATLSELISGDYYEQYKDLDCKIYQLTYTGQPYTPQLKTPVFTGYTLANPADTWLKMEGAADSMTINMDTEESKEGVMIFQKSGGATAFVLVCTFQAGN